MIEGYYVSETILTRIAEWTVPKKILEFFADGSKNFCRDCGMGYPSKRRVFSYLFWEVWVLGLKLAQSCKGLALEMKSLD